MVANRLCKLIRLWGVYARMDLLWVTRDSRYALATVISDLLVNLGGVLAVFLLAERFDGLGAWTKAQILFMLGYATAVTGIMNTFFTFNILHVSRRIGRGQLDHTLVQPQPLWMSLLTEGFMPFSGSMPLLAGLGILAYASARMHIPCSFEWLLALALQLAASSVVLLAFSFITGSLAFWAPRAAEEMCSLTVDMMSSLRSFPLDAVGTTLSTILLTALPVGYMAWQPCRSLLGIAHRPFDLALTPLAAVLLGTAAVLMFRKGLRHYATTGSQRYLDYGHRR